MIVTARFVVPVDGPVVEWGAVYCKDGVIRAVGPAKNMPPDPVVEDFGDAVLLPGLVNAHTHLELSDLRGRVPPASSLVDWLSRLLDARTAQPPDEDSTRSVVRAAVKASIRFGVTAIGDITTSPAWTRPTLRQSPMRAVSFGEVIAIGERQAGFEDRLAGAASTEWHTEHLRIGISPHAPYTVSAVAMQACARHAESARLPICMHLAESAEEEAFTRHAGGPLAEFLKRRGVWNENITANGVGPIELAEQCGVLGPRCVIAHANYVGDEDIDRIARAGASVAYCPRTHDAFGHTPHRFEDMLDRGINVCIGTDSLASNPDLDVLAEIRFLRARSREISAMRLIEMATIRGARALGFDAVVGSLAPGKSADLVIVPLGGSGSVSWDEVLRSDAAPAAVYIGGRRVAFAR